jgi:putative ABC transport system permease protein
VGSLRALVHELDPVQEVPDVHPWNQVYEQIQKALRLITQVIGAMGAMGIALALVGLYGLIAYDVSTRTREIGIRMALGAARGSVLRMVLWHGLVLSVCGIGVGMLLNYGAGRLLVFAFRINQSDTADGWRFEFSNLSFALLLLAVLALTTLAAYIPARRAARVDPTVALRCE